MCIRWRKRKDIQVHIFSKSPRQKKNFPKKNMKGKKKNRKSVFFLHSQTLKLIFVFQLAFVKRGRCINWVSSWENERIQWPEEIKLNHVDFLYPAVDLHFSRTFPSRVNNFHCPKIAWKRRWQEKKNQFLALNPNYSESIARVEFLCYCKQIDWKWLSGFAFYCRFVAFFLVFFLIEFL